MLARTPVRGSLIFAGPVTAIGESQLKTWLIEWVRSLKTKANYHGLIYGVFAYAVKRGYLAANPAIGTAPKQSRVKQSRPELRFLTERELETAVRLAKRHGDVLAVTAGTGLRFGEISALWVGDVDLDRGTVRVNKAWKRNGEDDATETPGWLSRQLRAKHTMRDHHLGHPKTPRSRRTIMIAPTVAALRGGMAMTQVSWLSSPQLALARVRWSSDEIRVRNDAAPVTVQLARFSCSLSGDTDRRTVLRLFLGRRRPRSAGAGLARLGSIKRAGPRPPILIQVRRVRCA